MRLTLILLSLLMIAGSPLSAQTPIRTLSPPVQLHSRWVDSLYSRLSLNERIAQLLMIPAYSNRDKAHIEEVSQLIRQYGVGSVLFFQGGPGRQLSMAERFQRESKVPLLMAIDGEWGLFMRLDSVPRLPRQMLLGAIQNDSIIYEMGRFVADQCRRVGLHINFAPAVDVNSNRNNPVIGTRSFGEDPRRVAQLAIAYMKGMQEGGLFTAAKHFPGHGDTETDSHLTLPIVNRTRAELDSVELAPFRAMISAGVSGIMSAHLFVPAIDNQSQLPTSLSKKAITDLLRQELRFEGLIYTDALNMKGASEAFRSGELEVRAFEAGNDILVMPANIPRAISAIREAILSGRVDSALLESSCRRILAAKEMAGLAVKKPLSRQNLHADLNSRDAGLLQHKIMENAITLLNNHNRTVPINGLENKRIAMVLAGTEKSNFFVKRVADYCKTDLYFLPEQQSLHPALLNKLQPYDLIIGGVHNTNSLPAKNFGVSASTIAFFDQLSSQKPLILSLFGCPYAWSSSKAASRYEAFIVAYEESELAHDKTAQILFGAIGAKGRLPVSINDSLRCGMGIDTRGDLRLAYVLPESIGINSDSLTKIDRLVEEAIAAKAMPGCQVMAAKEGKVFFRKNYGATRYSGGVAVTDSTIYDLASVTKIAASV
ncbi:MAG: glycoside hydrolase family 3 N-terminal domain-containing protein, partial [Bacteroidales bacterium]